MASNGATSSNGAKQCIGLVPSSGSASMSTSSNISSLGNSHRLKQTYNSSNFSMESPPRHMEDVDDDDLGDVTEESDQSQESPLAKHDFLVSFLVDARGGSMTGCRLSGIRVSLIFLTCQLLLPVQCLSSLHCSCGYLCV